MDCEVLAAALTSLAMVTTLSARRLSSFALATVVSMRSCLSSCETMVLKTVDGPYLRTVCKHVAHNDVVSGLSCLNKDFLWAELLLSLRIAILCFIRSAYCLCSILLQLRRADIEHTAQHKSRCTCSCYAERVLRYGAYMVNSQYRERTHGFT